MEEYIISNEKQVELRERIAMMQQSSPQSIRSMARECYMQHNSIARFIRGSSINWITYMKLLAFIERKESRIWGEHV
jgi:hypothetical protein